MAEQIVPVDILKLDQDLAGNVTGGRFVYPPERAGEALSPDDARVYYNDSEDGFDIAQNGRVYQITPLFVDDEVDDVPVTGDEATDVQALVDVLASVLNRVPAISRRKAVIFERAVPY